MHRSRNPERSLHPKRLRNAVQPNSSIMLEVLTSIENIEASNPKQHCSSQGHDPYIERSTHCDPGRGRRNPQRKSKHQMRPTRQPLHIAISQQHQQSQRSKLQRQTIQHRSSQHKHQRTNQNEPTHETRGQRPSRQSPHSSPRIRRIQIPIHQPIERHRRTPSRNHTNHNPTQHPQRRPTTSSQHSPSQCKRECEHRVFPLDHLQRRRSILPKSAHTLS